MHTVSNSMQHILPRETDSLSAGQENLGFYRTQRFIKFTGSCPESGESSPHLATHFSLCLF